MGRQRRDVSFGNQNHDQWQQRAIHHVGQSDGAGMHGLLFRVFTNTDTLRERPSAGTLALRMHMPSSESLISAATPDFASFWILLSSSRRESSSTRQRLSMKFGRGGNQSLRVDRTCSMTGETDARYYHVHVPW
jgi:hypothetical protein